MEFKRGMTKVPVTYADFSMVSAADDRILLPYVGKLWDDVLFEATQLARSVAKPNTQAMNAFHYEDLVSKTVVHIGFSVQHNIVRPYADLRVRTRTGKTVVKRFVLKCSDDEIVNVLDHFFQQGCQGIKPEFADYFNQCYKLWQRFKK